ncbi:hypothetical protein C8Q70DRAFT_1055782 [Cubamyces menziesii]|uniref:DUF6534 domain-containing protein n=1 Tax=Trametes cubensis TaxID=1111947 RepID=A0AAD7TXR6_9APHY|nr:hypothetical protein C8Q70DRAFT_1055782 [Cubamyces menziesii]KAJ8483367.1 hypothetical protein ONZ51_g4761 [Trametes cubensis]
MDTSPPATVATPAGQDLGSTYGAMLLSTIIAAALYGVSVLQALYYYDKFPEDHWGIKITVAAVWVLDTASTVMNAHAVYYYLIANYNNPPALLTEVWSVQIEMLVTFTAVLVVQLFFIKRIFKLRPDFWYIPLFLVSRSIFFEKDTITDPKQMIVAAASYALIIVIAAHITSFKAPWDSIATPQVNNPVIANWATGLFVDVSITAVLCWYLWSEKSGVRKRTHRMINRIIVFSVNRGAFAAVMQLLTFVTKFITPQNLVWFAFHNVLCKVYTNSMLATLNSRLALRSMMSDTEQLGTTQVSLPAIWPSTPGAGNPGQTRAQNHHFSSIRFASALTSETDRRSIDADAGSEHSDSNENVVKTNADATVKAMHPLHTV